jgi:membrane protease YdiL (CAAX protease family)
MIKDIIKKDFFEIKNVYLSLNKNILIILISFPILQTISWYYSSRKFFEENIYPVWFRGDELADLYEFLYWFFCDTFLYLILTTIIIKFVLKEKISDYGFKFGDKKGFIYALVFFLFMIPILWIVSSMPEFTEKYPHLPLTKANFKIFFIYEIGMLIYLFAWEFVFRGYLLFGLFKKFNYYAIFIQMIPFVILHNGKPALETFSAIFGGIILGYLAIKTSSFFYGFLLHFGIMFIIDLFSIIRFKTDYYGIEFTKIIKIFSFN